jgi:cathepsin D
LQLDVEEQLENRS